MTQAVENDAARVNLNNRKKTIGHLAKPHSE